MTCDKFLFNEGMIDENGWLLIRRKDKLKNQLCPYPVYMTLDAPSAGFCGDWCPFFCEPEEFAELDGRRKGRYLLHLIICKRELIFMKFKDKRLSAKTDEREA